MGGIRTGVRAGVAALLVSAGLVSTNAGPATAEEPTVSLSSDHVDDGQKVDIEISGFPAGYTSLVQCSGSILGPGARWRGECTLVELLALGTLPPSHVEWTVTSSFKTYDGTKQVECRTDPAGCVVGVMTVRTTGALEEIVASAVAPLTFTPRITGDPARQLGDGTTVVVEGAAIPPGRGTIAQCGRAVVQGDPTPAEVEGSCGPARPVTVNGDGTLTAQLTVHDPLTSPDGRPVPCGSAGCVVVLASPDDPVVAYFGVAFGPATLAVTPTTDLTEHSPFVQVTVTGAPDGADVYQCALPLVPGWLGNRCDIPTPPLTLDTWGGAVYERGAPPRFRNAFTYATADCRVDDCGFVLLDEAATPLAEPVPLRFAAEPTLTLEPSEGLLDGQDMTVVAEHLQPDVEYTLARCLTWLECRAPGTKLVASAEGRIETTVPAASHFVTELNRPAYCRADGCMLLLRSPGGHLLRSSYAMAAGELAVTPATGLDDGQQVQVTGDQLMPTYGGAPAGPFLTGGWALTQCDAAVLGELHLLGVFRHCALGPPTEPVTIDGSTLDTTVTVAATVPKILGGSAACSTAPSACVVGLVRLEQDLSLSAHLVPITFG